MVSTDPVSDLAWAEFSFADDGDDCRPPQEARTIYNRVAVSILLWFMSFYLGEYSNPYIRKVIILKSFRKAPKVKSFFWISKPFTTGERGAIQ
jgi:hypothetical protein